MKRSIRYGIIGSAAIAALVPSGCEREKGSIDLTWERPAIDMRMDEVDINSSDRSVYTWWFSARGLRPDATDTSALVKVWTEVRTAESTRVVGPVYFRLVPGSSEKRNGPEPEAVYAIHFSKREFDSSSKEDAESLDIRWHAERVVPGTRLFPRPSPKGRRHAPYDRPNVVDLTDPTIGIWGVEHMSGESAREGKWFLSEMLSDRHSLSDFESSVLQKELRIVENWNAPEGEKPPRQSEPETNGYIGVGTATYFASGTIDSAGEKQTLGLFFPYVEDETSPRLAYVISVHARWLTAAEAEKIQASLSPAAVDRAQR